MSISRQVCMSTFCTPILVIWVKVTPTAVASVSRPTMLVGGASTTKCAVVLQLPALKKQTGIRLVFSHYMPLHPLHFLIRNGMCIMYWKCMWLTVHCFTCPVFQKGLGYTYFNYIQLLLHEHSVLHTHSWMGVTPSTWMCVLSWSPHPRPPETMCNQWVFIGTFNYKPETYLLQWVQCNELSFNTRNFCVYALITPNSADQWIQLCLSSERHVWPSNSLQQWQLPHLSGEPKSGNAYDLSPSGSIVILDCDLGVTVYMLPQIQSSSSSGREDVTISIIWMNPSTGLRHTIDALTPVSCECGLVCIRCLGTQSHNVLFSL